MEADRHCWEGICYTVKIRADAVYPQDAHIVRDHGDPTAQLGGDLAVDEELLQLPGAAFEADLVA